MTCTSTSLGIGENSYIHFYQFLQLEKQSESNATINQIKEQILLNQKSQMDQKEIVRIQHT